MNNETIKSPEVKCPEVTPEDEIIDLHPPFLTAKSSAKWNESKRRYYYKPLDTEYDKKHYHKHKQETACIHCGSVVISQMYKHVKSKKCIMFRNAVQQTMDKYKIEQDTSSNTLIIP